MLSSGKATEWRKRSSSASMTGMSRRTIRNCFPSYKDGLGVMKGKNGFEFVRAKEAAKEQHDREGTEWMMPNLSNLTIRAAIEKLSAKTAKIRVHGSGNVTDQEPKPFQRISGETECVIYGRAGR